MTDFNQSQFQTLPDSTSHKAFTHTERLAAVERERDHELLTFRDELNQRGMALHQISQVIKLSLNLLPIEVQATEASSSEIEIAIRHATKVLNVSYPAHTDSELS